MFSASKKTQERNVKNEESGNAVPSIVSVDLKIKGDLISSGEIHVDGTVEGDIQCSAVMIGINGSVMGEIKADSVHLHGTVNGVIWGKAVFLASTAHMIGDITHERLSIEPGAYMEGHCGRMDSSSEKETDGKGSDRDQKKGFSLASTLARRPIKTADEKTPGGEVSPGGETIGADVKSEKKDA